LPKKPVQLLGVLTKLLEGHSQTQRPN